MTSAQEIGWYSEDLCPKSMAMHNGIKQTPITSYGAEYALLKHKNPFCRDVHLFRDMDQPIPKM